MKIEIAIGSNRRVLDISYMRPCFKCGGEARFADEGDEKKVKFHCQECNLKDKSKPQIVVMPETIKNVNAILKTKYTAKDLIKMVKKAKKEAKE